jgi:hypothetical protein
MSKNSLLLVVVGVLTISGCASNVAVRYPAARSNDGETGAVLVRFTEPVRAVNVSIDGLLVVEDEHTERVHIADVPTGTWEVSIVAEAGGRAEAVERSEILNVTAGQEVSVLVAVPPRSLGYWIWQAAFVIAYATITVTTDWWRN